MNQPVAVTRHADLVVTNDRRLRRDVKALIRLSSGWRAHSAPTSSVRESRRGAAQLVTSLGADLMRAPDRSACEPQVCPHCEAIVWVIEL